MATIITKNSSTASSVPLNTQLVQGELAVNVTDKRLFTENASGTVVELGTNPSSLTLPNGTANGVPYLNGSKVLTTGSALVFDGTNLGIGTSSPSSKLHVEVSGASSIITNKGTSSNYYGYAGSTLVTQLLSSTTQTYLNSVANVPIIFGTNDTERARIDSSGNLGLGVTPSAWQSGFKAIDVGSASAFFASGVGQPVISYNHYYNGGDKYKTNNFASAYEQLSGQHRWYTAPSGTAGNTITFTQAMTLDASQRLMIGTTTAGASGTSVTVYDSTQSEIRLQNSTTGTGVSAGLQLALSGTTAYLWNIANGPLVFATNNTERARIDSSGRFLVGRTSIRSNEFASFTGAPGDAGWTVEAINTRTTGSVMGILSYYPNVSPNNTASVFFQATDSSATRAEIRSNGGIANYQANNVNLSDRREKTNFAPAGEYLSKICAIPVQTYNYIDQNMEEDPGTTLGVVAQDVQAVAPELVSESNWGTADNPKMRLSIYQTDLQYALMKCIQEQQAIIESLKADVAALKAAA